jgi:pheromone shutdown protein TraB
MAAKLITLLLSGKKIVCVVGAGHVPGIYERLSRMLSGSWSLTLEYRA